MSENNQEILVHISKSSKEAIYEFIKYYLDYSDSILDTIEDENDLCSFKIFEYESYLRDHNSSFNMIKPQFSFLFPRYYVTVMIDLTTSMLNSTNDGDVKIEKGLETLKEFFFCVAKSYSFNNGVIIYDPEVIVNVLCFSNNKIEIIIKGWELKVHKTNFTDFSNMVLKAIYNQITQERSTLSRDIFFTVIREGVISLNLFEDDKKSLKHLVILTDGQYPVNDGVCLERCLLLLRHCHICCSFIHVKTSSPDISLHSSITDQGHDDQLRFISNATGGFYKTTEEMVFDGDRYILRYRYFDQSDNFDTEPIPLKSLSDRNVNAPPINVIFSIINMGYFLTSVNNLRDSRIEVELILPWRSDVYFKVSIGSKLPFEQQRKCLFSLSIFGQSLFLNGIGKTVTLNSNDIDQNLLRCFRGQIMKEIKHSLYNIEIFSQFNIKPNYLIPTFITNGLKPMFSPTNQPCDKIDKQSKPFFDFWTKTLKFTYLSCFNTTKIHLLLEHDFPFPPYLSIPDPITKSYSSIQSRQSLVQLSGLINKNFCNFIVQENNTYVKFFPDNANNAIPNYFCVLKMICQGLEVKLLLHFFIPTPEKIRDEFVVNLVNKINILKFQPRGKQARPRHMSSQMTKNREHVPPQQRSWEQINCCTVLSFDLSNLIALYNPIKGIDVQNKIMRRDKMSLSMLYLHNNCQHDYRIWIINDMFAKNIFETLIKLRLQEGFHIAISDSTSGFINLIKEVQLVNNENNVYKCFIQYVIYPDNCRPRKDSDNLSVMDEQTSFENATAVQKIFTEIFIEKKFGKVMNAEPEVISWEGLAYCDIPDTINDLDLRAIETFVTFECFKIYPMTLSKVMVKPNLCSVLNKSPRMLLYCPLYISDLLENFVVINSVFMNLLDNNLKLHGFNHIDITKTENANFNKLVKTYSGFEKEEHHSNWNCYYTFKVESLLVVMIPSHIAEYKFDSLSSNALPIFVYAMSLKHLSFLIEDCWTLKLPDSRQYSLPLDSIYDLDSVCLESKLPPDFDKSNEFAVEIDKLQHLLSQSVQKLDSIYLLTFVGGVHKNLRENREMDRSDLSNTFFKYCSERLFYDVDATKFINTICSHCYSALKIGPVLPLSSLILFNKDNCEFKPGMHHRIVKRIRQMMAKYFREIPSFPSILIYCPENDIESNIECNENDKSDDFQSLFIDDMLFCRQKSLDQGNGPIDPELNFTDSMSEVKSVSSCRFINQPSQCPLFISINYTLIYDKNKKYLKFDNIPTCICDFIDDIKSIVDGELNFHKLKFNLDLIPITYIDEELGNLLAKSKNEDQSLAGEVNSGSKKHPLEISKRYLTPGQTQLLDECKIELIWSLEDEVVNCLKYCSTIDGTTMDIVKRHIENTSTMKLQKNFAHEIQKKTFDLDFVFGFEKSKLLFQQRFEKITFGKHNQYGINKMDGIYCVFQTRKLLNDQSALFSCFPDQTFDEMNFFMQSRLRVDSLCLTSLQTASDNLKGDYLRRCSSEGKLSDLKFVRKMCESKRESLTLFDKVDNPVNADTIKTDVIPDCQPISGNVNQQTSYHMGPTNPRQYRSLMPSINQQSSSQTPRRHRSGETGSVMFTGNYRSDTPMLNDLVSTATSSKGYEGDSSRVSDGEDYDRFSSCPADIKINTVQENVGPFWLLLQIMETQKQILAYFHHTDTCTFMSQDKCEHCDSISNIFEKITECVHQVNQCLLLEQLAQTRMCRDMLIPGDPMDNKSSHGNPMFEFDFDEDNSDLSKKFDRGKFSCPLISKITFKLHPRLKGSADKNSKAIPSLRMTLENIAILNRKNMLIFIDDSTNGIFYSLLNEISKELNAFELEQLNENSVLISDPSNSEIDPPNPELCERESFQRNILENADNISIKSAPVTSDIRSSYKYFPAVTTKTMDLLELSVYGVDKLSEATIKSIIANIGSKLDSIVLRHLSDSICRSSTIWLCKEDLDFLLRIDYNNKPQKPKSVYWLLPKLALKHTLAFCYYLKQNLQLNFISPKIADMSLYEKLNLSNGLFGEVYLYNQSSAQGVANDAIVILTVQLVSLQSQSSWLIDDYSIPEFQEDEDLNLNYVIQENRLIEIDNLDKEQGQGCCLKLNIWLRGQVESEIIKNKLYNISQCSINDLLLEFVLIPRPISTINTQLLSQLKANKSDVDSLLSALENGENGTLQRLYSEDLFNWFPELSKSENLLIKHRKTDMFSDFNVEFLINDLVDGMNESINFNAFYLCDGAWIPWNSKQPRSGKDYPGMKRSFILIGRIEELWKKFVFKKWVANTDNTDLNLSLSQSSQTSTASSGLTCSRKCRMLLRQLPFENSGLNCSTTSSTSTLHLTNNTSQNLPEFCQINVQGSVNIPRQMLCILKIDGCHIDTISYNLAKDATDNLNNLIDTIIKNHKSRFQMLNSFIHQKLGLFHESSSKSCLPSLTINMVKNFSQIGKVKNTNLNSSDISRDRRPSGSPRSFSPASRVNVPSTLAGQAKALNKNQVPKKMQYSIDISRIYKDPYTISSLADVKRIDSINDVIYQQASQFISTHNSEMKRRILNKKIKQCISLFQPKNSFNQSENSEILCPLEQLDVFSTMKRACRIFHSVVCPILFIPSVRKRLLNLSLKKSNSEIDTDYDESSEIEEWMNVMSVTLLGYYAEYVQKEHGFQFVNPPRPNVSQNPCSHALFQKSINNSGIYLMEVFILKGCLCVRLSVFECRRLSGFITGFPHIFSGFPQPNQQPQKTFVKDICKLCDLTHLFSFIYDFYVGMVVKSITHPEENKKYFNVISFMRDFVKMYSYPPMYACNHIYWMPYPISSDLIKPNDLFDFLVRHYEDYNYMFSHNVSDKLNIRSDQLFVYTVNNEPFANQSIIDINAHTPPSSSPLNLHQNNRNIDEKNLHPNLEFDFVSIFCLTKSADQPNSSFDLFIVTFDKSSSFPHPVLIQIKKMESKENVFYPAKYLSILPHKSSSPDNMLHLAYCPISINSIDTGQLPNSLSWKTYDNRSVVPLQVPLFLTLRSRIESYMTQSDAKLKRAIMACHKDSLWHRMYKKPDTKNSSKFSLQFNEFQDLINSGDIVDIFELDPRLVDSMKIAASYLRELDKCMCLLSEDCFTLLYENAAPIYKSTDDNLSTHLVLMSKNTTDGFLLLSKTQRLNSDDCQVELKAVFRSQDCRSRILPKARYFSSSLREVTVMLAETAAFCIWRKLTEKL